MIKKIILAVIIFLSTNLSAEENIQTNIDMFYKYVLTQDLPNATKFYNSLKVKYPNNSRIDALKQALNLLNDKILLSLKEDYDKKRDYKSLSPYVFSLYDLKRVDEAIIVTKDYIRLKNDSQGKILLSNLLSWSGKTKKIAPKTAPKIAPEVDKNHKMALKYYQEKDYQKALPYYKKYLLTNSDNLDARYQYATVLENLKEYNLAQLEFKSVYLKRTKLYFLAKYHYGFNLLKIKNKKARKKSIGILSELLSELKSNPETKEKRDLAYFTKDALKYAKQPLQLPSYHNGIYLEANQKRKLNYKDVFSYSDIVSSKVDRTSDLLKMKKISDKKLQIEKKQPIQEVEIPNKRELNTYLESTKGDDEIYKLSYGIRTKNLINFGAVLLDFDVEKSDFSKTDDNYNAFGYSLIASSENFSFILGSDVFDNDDFLHLALRYTFQNDLHDFYSQISYRNGIFYNYQKCMIDSKTMATQLAISDIIKLKNNKTSKVSLEINSYENDNLNIYGSFKYPIFVQELLGLKHIVSLNQVLDYNSKEDLCYYTDELYDETKLNLESIYKIGENSLWGIKGGLGYSFEAKDSVYEYGINSKIDMDNSLDFTLDCTVQESKASHYSWQSCGLNIGYEW